MYKNFENLNQDKKRTILEACIHEFAARGFENASTNSIIKEAGISKGILFHYFGNKKSLFLYIVDYGIQTIREEYDKYPLMETGDIFKRLIELGVLKLKLHHAFPDISKILIEALANSPEDLRSEVERKCNSISKEYMPVLFEKIDDSKFREGVNTTKAIQILTLFLEALGEKYLKDYQGREQDLLQDIDKIMDEYYEYMEILKYGMYSS
ncbi:MAG TPA: TetR/AcrR family transcriptional regulator [Desulfosporosinus sp.]